MLDRSQYHELKLVVDGPSVKISVDGQLVRTIPVSIRHSRSTTSRMRQSPGTSAVTSCLA